MKKIIVLVVLLALKNLAFGQLSQVRNSIEKIVADKKLELGFALYDFSTGDTLSINGEKRFPMQSVFKFPIALAMLHEVDNKKFDLEQKIYLGKEDLRPGLWSPIEKQYPGGEVYLPLSEILKQTVSLSDNVGCDLLLKLLGGPLVVNDYIHGKGIADIRIQNNEQEIQSSWNVQFDNWITPDAMIQLLMQFNAKKLLLPESHSFLWKVMAETSTGSIKNKLPENVVVVHKTGHSGYNEKKVSAATNDVGIMVAPNGKRLAFAIFVADSKEPQEVNANVIADIAVVLLQALQ